jgi:hypothetical protein
MFAFKFSEELRSAHPRHNLSPWHVCKIVRRKAALYGDKLLRITIISFVVLRYSFFGAAFISLQAAILHVDVLSPIYFMIYKTLQCEMAYLIPLH